MLGLPIELAQLVILSVPGFVAMKVFGLLVPSRRVDWGSAMLEVLAYGSFNIGIWLWLFRDIGKFPSAERLPSWAALAAFGIMFVSPALLAALTWRLRQTRFLQRWLSNPFPTAWDYFFARKQPCWMLFKLRNGGQFGGYFGINSFATSHPEARDVYVEDLWRVDEHGRFIGRLEGNLGAVVRFNDCQELQFFATEESRG